MATRKASKKPSPSEADRGTGAVGRPATGLRVPDPKPTPGTPPTKVHAHAGEVFLSFQRLLRVLSPLFDGEADALPERLADRRTAIRGKASRVILELQQLDWRSIETGSPTRETEVAADVQPLELKDSKADSGGRRSALHGLDQDQQYELGLAIEAYERAHDHDAEADEQAAERCREVVFALAACGWWLGSVLPHRDEAERRLANEFVVKLHELAEQYRDKFLASFEDRWSKASTSALWEPLPAFRETTPVKSSKGGRRPEALAEFIRRVSPLGLKPAAIASLTGVARNVVRQSRKRAKKRKSGRGTKPR